MVSSFSEARAKYVVPLLRTRRRQELEAALAGGADPADSPALSAFAEDLQRPETCHALAASVMNLVDAAEEPARTWRVYGVDPPLRARAVVAARDALIALAAVLRTTERPAARGVALASWLVHNPASPVYDETAGGDIAAYANEASAMCLGFSASWRRP